MAATLLQNPANWDQLERRIHQVIFFIWSFFVTNNVYIEKPEIADHNILDEDDIKSIASFPDLEWTFSTTSLVTFTKVLSSKMGRGAPHTAWVVSKVPAKLFGPLFGHSHGFWYLYFATMMDRPPHLSDIFHRGLLRIVVACHPDLSEAALS